MTKGIIIGGEFGNIIIREKSTNKIELGELLVTKLLDGSNIMLQVFDLLYGSQLPQQALELVSGLKLEEETNLKFFDPHLRNYVLARAKNIVAIKNNKITACKNLPDFFSEVNQITANDLGFLTTPRENALKIGLLRSGSTTLNVPLYMPGDKVLSHHMLISGTTGRGKSVLMTNLLWNFVNQNYCGILVLDPHDEYIGRTNIGLKDHPSARENVHYYTASKPIPGGMLLKINIGQITPNHFNGVMNWSEPQREALLAYYREYKNEWVKAIIEEKPLSVKFNEATIAVIKRRLVQLLNLEIVGKEIICKGIFDFISGQTTISNIVNLLERGKLVIVDTSEFSGAAELLVGTLIATETFEKHRALTFSELLQRPVISIVLEEAPRVLGKDILEQGPNIFSTIAREGRKFRIGLVAITQLPSLIPKEILANMNTKIILGTELKQERQALIESAAQDLSTDDRAISSLDKGEAIVTSTFVSFATPIKVQRIEELIVKKETQKEFGGVKL